MDHTVFTFGIYNTVCVACEVACDTVSRDLKAEDGDFGFRKM